MEKECRHHFVARYSEESRGIKFSECSGISIEELRSLMTINKYVYDICTKCGKIIKDSK